MIEKTSNDLNISMNMKHGNCALCSIHRPISLDPLILEGTVHLFGQFQGKLNRPLAIHWYLTYFSKITVDGEMSDLSIGNVWYLCVKTI